MAIQTKPHFVKILRSGRTKLKDQTLMREMNYTHALEIIQDMWAEEQGQVEQKCLKHNYMYRADGVDGPQEMEIN